MSQTTGPADVVELLQRLITIPSLPGEEGDLARWIVHHLERRGASAQVDRSGNVVAKVAGRGDAPAMAFNTHLDHVDVGDHSRWPYPPFAGRVADGCVWGRGAVDIKGPLAAQICAFLRLVDGPPPAGDVFLTAVVQEEIGGLGARRLIETCSAQTFVVGEPSSSQVRCGHRGRVEVTAHAVGRSCHASVPEEGANPLYSLARFLLELERAELPSDPVLGRATAVPTLLRTDQTSSNVVPGEVWQTIDYRCIPEQNASAIVESLELVARAAAGGGEPLGISVPSTKIVSWTGDELEMPADNPAYLLGFDSSEVSAAREIVAEQIGSDAGVGTWAFATDGGHFASAGRQPVGFGPGDDLLAHTVDERIEISELRAAVDVYEALGRELTSRVG